MTDKYEELAIMIFADGNPLKKAVNTLRTLRNETLEEAAKVVESHQPVYTGYADKIRNLKEKL